MTPPEKLKAIPARLRLNIAELDQAELTLEALGNSIAVQAAAISTLCVVIEDLIKLNSLKEE